MLLSASKCQAHGLRFEVRAWDGVGSTVGFLNLGCSRFREIRVRGFEVAVCGFLSQD